MCVLGGIMYVVGKENKMEENDKACVSKTLYMWKSTLKMQKETELGIFSNCQK